MAGDAVSLRRSCRGRPLKFGVKGVGLRQAFVASPAVDRACRLVVRPGARIHAVVAVGAGKRRVCRTAGFACIDKEGHAAAVPHHLKQVIAMAGEAGFVAAGAAKYRGERGGRQRGAG